MSAKRVFFWTQHLLGTGHLRRTLTLAQACTAAGLQVLVASGGPPSPWPIPKQVGWLQLPALHTIDATFSGLVDADGRPPDAALWAARAGALRDAFDAFAPDALVTEMYPFGRGAFRAEVDALLARAAELGVPCVASVRDVLVTKDDHARLVRMRDRAISGYARVLVHGWPPVIPFTTSFPLASELGPRLVHTGWVTSPASAAASPPPRRDLVLVSAGGGRVGQGLLTAALAARPLGRQAGKPWHVVTGSGLDAAAEAALGGGSADPSLTLERHRDDLGPFLRRALVSVSQAGYNTVVETLAAGAPMVIVPFQTAAEDEQGKRAARLATLGMATVLDANGLAPAALARAIDAAAARRPPALPAAAFAGAERTAAILVQLTAAQSGPALA